MTKVILNRIRFTRAIAVRALKPKANYFLATKSIRPLSSKFGFDRGTPIDRYWIDSFIGENQSYIHGKCLEIGDDRYTRRFGRNVTKSDILDVDKKNKKATIYGDLRNLASIIADNTYDCIILTHVLGMIDDYEATVRECKRILKRGGTLLVTTSCFSPTHDINANFFRFTVASARYVFGKYFRKKNLLVKSYGNVLTGQCFWVGLAQEELTKKELEFNDPHFPCIVAIKANK